MHSISAVCDSTFIHQKFQEFPKFERENTSKMSVRGLQILTRRSHNLNRIHLMSQRAYHHGNWHKYTRRWHKLRRWGDKMKHDHYANMEHGHHGKKFGHWHGHRYHGHWHHPRVVYKYYKSPWQFAGMSLAMIISFKQNESIMWACIHGFFSWFYVAYYAYQNSELSAKDSIHAQVNEIHAEIDKLAGVYQKLQSAVNDFDVSIKQQENQTLDRSIPASTSEIVFNDDDAQSGAKA